MPKQAIKATDRQELKEIHDIAYEQLSNAELLLKATRQEVEELKQYFSEVYGVSVLHFSNLDRMIHITRAMLNNDAEYHESSKEHIESLEKEQAA